MPMPIHRDESRRFLFGVATLVLLAVVAVIGGIVQTGGALPGKQYTYVTATFRDVGTLKTGKEVKTAGVRIGTVSDIEYDEGDAVVTLRLDGDRDVYADASAYVGNVSALGKKYVELDPGTAAAGEIGADGIPVASTRPATSVEEILGAFDPETRAQLQSALQELSTGVAGHGEDLNVALARSPQLLADVWRVTGALTSPPADVPGALTSADRLVDRFRGREDQIAALMDNADQTMQALAVEEGQPLATAVSELPATLDHAKGALDALRAPLADARVAVHTVRPGGTALGRSSGSLRAFLRDSVGPLRKVPPVADEATPAVADLTGTLADARPLVPRVHAAVTSLAQLLVPFAPYAGDAGRFFSQHDLLSGTLGSDDQHYFAAMLTAPGLFSVDGLPDPLYRQEAYPVPGTAWNHATLTDVRK